MQNSLVDPFDMLAYRRTGEEYKRSNENCQKVILEEDRTDEGIVL